MRPKFEEIVPKEPVGYVECRCGAWLSNRELLLKHWNEGHFDEPDEPPQMSAAMRELMDASAEAEEYERTRPRWMFGRKRRRRARPLPGAS